MYTPLRSKLPGTILRDDSLTTRKLLLPHTISRALSVEGALHRI